MVQVGSEGKIISLDDERLLESLRRLKVRLDLAEMVISILWSPSTAAYLIPTTLLCLIIGNTMTLRVLFDANILAADVQLLLTWNKVKSKQWLAAWWKLTSVLDLSSWLNLKALAWAICCTPLKSRIMDIFVLSDPLRKSRMYRDTVIYTVFTPESSCYPSQTEIERVVLKSFCFYDNQGFYKFSNFAKKLL